MEKMSIENLIKVNKMFNAAPQVLVNKKEDCVILTFMDEDGEIDATVLTYTEFDLVRNNSFINLD
ncbi:hypothetical protein KK120_18710 [Virgibacillus dakarensis]|nr:hypothetical protein [Virgibacillus dakarensis]